MGPSIGMTPILSPNDRRVEGPKKVRMMVISTPRKRTAMPRIMITVSMGRFFPDIFCILWEPVPMPGKVAILGVKALRHETTQNNWNLGYVSGRQIVSVSSACISTEEFSAESLLSFPSSVVFPAFRASDEDSRSRLIIPSLNSSPRFEVASL